MFPFPRLIKKLILEIKLIIQTGEDLTLATETVAKKYNMTSSNLLSIYKNNNN